MTTDACLRFWNCVSDEVQARDGLIRTLLSTILTLECSIGLLDSTILCRVKRGWWKFEVRVFLVTPARSCISGSQRGARRSPALAAVRQPRPLHELGKHCSLPVPFYLPSFDILPVHRSRSLRFLHISLATRQDGVTDVSTTFRSSQLTAYLQQEIVLQRLAFHILRTLPYDPLLSRHMGCCS